MSFANAPRASFWRRLAAWVYDFLLALAVYMLAGTLLFALFALLVGTGLIDRGGLEHTSDVLQHSTVWSSLYYSGCLAAVIGLFVWSWTRSGQTLGMRAWRLRVQRRDGGLMNRQQSLYRVLYAFGGLANISLLWDDERLAMHDRLSGSEVVQLTLEQNRELMEKRAKGRS
ncbi:RDD family protein [Ferrimonas marina]|uniref:Uncharacterized membrane protein YckC, RDD family n=1 Tax=Ferrimonas marina TaxID=299255 RepID=A0A1M5X9A0_9GAMM|nr:RDD family protein [Ferrimonas marina]SHH96242.1 Uncharacterized membrane protein YckC, RDD family [Ferrimonas marina]